MSDFQQPSDRIGEFVPKSKAQQSLMDNGICFVDYTFEEWQAMRDKRHGKLRPKQEAE